MGDSIGNIFSGGNAQGFNTMAGGWQNAQNELNSLFSGANSNLQPFTQAGQNAIGGYTNFTNSLLNNMNGNWASNYQETPYAKFLTGQELNASNNAAAAGGTLGTGTNQTQDMSIANNVTAGDMQNYFNNQEQQNQQYLGAQNQLMGNGLSSAMSQGSLATNFGDMLMKAITGQSNAQAGAQVANQSGKNSATSGLLSGLTGMGGGGGMGASSGQNVIDYLFGA